MCVKKIILARFLAISIAREYFEFVLVFKAASKESFLNKDALECFQLSCEDAAGLVRRVKYLFIFRWFEMFHQDNLF